MYHMNDTILYGAEGVYQIVDITEMDFRGEKAEYYVLKSLHDSATVFVPSKNEGLLERMRRVLSAEEVHEIIKEMPNDESLAWIVDENTRIREYKEIILKGNHRDIVKLIKTLYLHRQEQRKIGKNLHKVDERFLKDAEKLLYSEFAYVLQIDPDQVLPFIRQQIDTEEKLQA